MRPSFAVVSVVLLFSVPASTQSPTIVLKVSAAPGSLGAPDASGRVTITLTSGTKITLPVTDIDIDQTRAASGLGSGSTTSPSRSQRPSIAEILLSPSMQDQAISTKCEQEWRTDFRMQAFCQTQQREAVVKLRGRNPITANERAIRQQCSEEWPGDFRMMDFCEERQLKALQELQRR